MKITNPYPIPWSYFSTDGTLASNSDSKSPSEKAIKTYADTKAPGTIAGFHFLTSTAETGLSAEVNLGLLTNGLLKHTVVAGVSAPATALDGTDYLSPTTGAPIPVTTSIASSATPTPAVGTVGAEIRYHITALAEAATFGAPTGTPVDGQKLEIRWKDNGAARALAWNAAYAVLSSSYTLPTTTEINATGYAGFVYDSAAGKWNLADSSQKNTNITGNAANLSGTPALPNGTTATSQAQADNSTKLATTAYVDTGLATKLTIPGAWTAVSFAGANFTASDGATWTVEAGDVATNKYLLEGKSLSWDLKIYTTSITVATPNILTIAIPGGYTAKSDGIPGMVRVLDNGTATSAYMYWDASGSVVNFRKLSGVAWILSADATALSFSVRFEVN